MSTAVNRPVWIPWEIVQWWAGWHGSERGEASAHRAVLTQRLSDWTHAEVSSRSTADHRAAVTLRSRSRTIRARDCESPQASQMSRSVLAATTITSRTNRARDCESPQASQMPRTVLAATTITRRTNRARDWESLKASQMLRSVLAATTITSRTNRARDCESPQASQMSRSVLAATTCLLYTSPSPRD